MNPPLVRHPGEYRWETRLLGAIAAGLTVWGLVSMYDASSLRQAGFLMMLKQLVIALGGGILLLILSRMDYHRLRRWAWPALGLTLVLLLIPALPLGLTGAIAPVRNGARRWILAGPLTMQPSELAKFVVVVWCAMLAAKKGQDIRRLGKGVVPFLTVIGVIGLLIVAEPNLSMAALVALLGATILFAAGARIAHFILLVGAGGLIGVQLVQMSEYRRARWATYLGHGAADGARQITESLVAIGSGGVFGVGLGEGKAKLAHLPYAHSDFLFSSIGEEWGLAGVLVVVVAFGAFGWLGFRIARTASDPFGQFLAAGLTTAVTLTAALHMAVTLSLLPTTGLTLPFMSAGGSSLVINLAAVGVLASVGRGRGRPPGR